jgi:hypothetical protein
LGRVERLRQINLNSGITFSFQRRRTEADTVCLDSVDVPRQNEAINFSEAIQQRMMATADDSHKLKSDGGSHGFSGKPLNDNLRIRI